jgi:predicted transcriptional regulator
MREVARRVGRDFKAVHADLETLLNSGVIDRADEGVVFPYDRIHFEFEIESAA